MLFQKPRYDDQHKRALNKEAFQFLALESSLLFLIQLSFSVARNTTQGENGGGLYLYGLSGLNLFLGWGHPLDLGRNNFNLSAEIRFCN